MIVVPFSAAIMATNLCTHSYSIDDRMQRLLTQLNSNSSTSMCNPKRSVRYLKKREGKQQKRRHINQVLIEYQIHTQHLPNLCVCFFTLNFRLIFLFW